MFGVIISSKLEKELEKKFTAEVKHLENEITKRVEDIFGRTHEEPPPTDRWNLLYIFLVLQGLGTLIAWNMFITAKDYFVKFKLADTEYAQNFLAYVGWASQIPNLLFNWFNVFAGVGGGLTFRVLSSIIIMLGIFIVTEALAMMDTSNMPGLFFWVTMICIFFLNGFNAIFQNSVFGVAARLPPKYMNAYVLGFNICGTIVVFMSFLSTFFNSLRTSAIYYFLCGIVVLIICFDTYIALPMNKFYRYCRSHVHDIAAPGITPKVPYGLIFSQTKAQLYNVFITFFVTLSVWPAVISDIVPVTEGFLGKYFMLITCFFTYSFMAMMGNVTAGFKQIPNKNFLLVFTTMRLLFIPAFMLCNYQVPERTLPVIINSDWLFWLLAAVHGWSSGHAGSLAMMYVGGCVAPENAAKAGMIGSAMLMTGLVCGVMLTRLLPIIVTMY